MDLMILIQFQVYKDYILVNKLTLELNPEIMNELKIKAGH